MLWLLAFVAQAAQVLLQVEPERLMEGQSGRVRLVVVENTAGRGTLRLSQVPVLPHEDGLSVGFEGQSSEFRVVNGQISQLLSFTYRLTAVREGDWRLGPVDVRLDSGSKVSTKAITIKVSPRSATQQDRPEVVATGAFDVEEAYEGQVVLYEYRLESTNPEARAEWQFPTFEGLRLPQEGQPEQRSFLIEDPEGSIFVSEGALPLIASGTGTREHPPAIAKVQTPIGPQRRLLFRRVRTDPWATRPASLTVRPLPKPPPDFSGLVGDFDVRSKVDRTQAVVGQSIGWTVQITGNGSLEGYTLPPYEVPGASVYDTDAYVVAKVQDGAYTSAATFTRALVPTQPGQWSPPAPTLVTFSPSQAAFVTHELSIPSIEVRPGREGAGEVTSFAPEASPDLELASIDMAPRPILRSGRANAWRLTGWLPLALGITALPGLLLWFREGVTGFAAWWEKRREVVIVERTAIEVLASAPREMEARQAAYEAALRIAIDAHPEDEELQGLFQTFLRARFGDGSVSRDLEDRIERAIRNREAP
ncbi:MAG: BatD family protein [Myxococcota bacterium]